MSSLIGGMWERRGRTRFERCDRQDRTKCDRLAGDLVAAHVRFRYASHTVTRTQELHYYYFSTINY